MRIMAGVFSDPSRVVAWGDCAHPEQLHGDQRRTERSAPPKKPIEVLQVIEYLRAFLVGREAWAGFNMLPIISGAFGIFQRDLVKQVGGFRTHAVGEDLDLVIRFIATSRKRAVPITSISFPILPAGRRRPQTWLRWRDSERVGTKA